MYMIEVLLLIPILFLSLSIHEFAHAYVANKLGDPTAKVLGRVTLDPRAHLDPVGSILLLVTLITPGPAFGWGKPVPVNESNFSNPKRDSALVSFAGPASNIILALLCVGIFHILGSQNQLIGGILRSVIILNVVLAVFNLLPVNPLDGFKVVNGLLPKELSYQWIQIGQYGIWILLVLVLTGAIDRIIYPIINLFLNILQI